MPEARRILTTLTAEDRAFLTHPEFIDLAGEDTSAARALVDTLEATPKAVGLHARQVGFRSNIFAFRETPDKIVLIIEPTFVLTSGPQTYEKESCLSELDDRGELIPFWVPRSQVVTFKDVQGCEYKYQGFPARVCQHEIDHGQGILLMGKDGVADMRTAKNPQKEVGRNEPCTCGSGKKWKRCCGK